MVIIHGIAKLLAGADRALIRKFGFLLNQGPASGYRFIATATDPLSRDVRILLKYDFPLRLVGRMRDADRAWAAAGISGTGAEKIRETGAFFAVRKEVICRFQAVLLGALRDMAIYSVSVHSVGCTRLGTCGT